MASPTLVLPKMAAPSSISVSPAAVRRRPTSVPTSRAHSRNSPGARSSRASRAATRAPGESSRALSPRDVNARSVRLTRRGRVAAFISSLAALAAIVVGAGQMADASGQATVADPTVVVVQSGETLWGIAQNVAPGHDPRGVIAQIRDLNDLGTRSIVPGQSLVVPTLG